MDRTPFLVGVEGPLAGRRWEVTAGGLRLGREAQNEVHIDENGASRQHARVLLHNGAVWVQDAGSRNGIHVNGQRVPDHKQLKEGDRLIVGTHAFTVELVAPVQAPSAPEPSAPRPPVLPLAVAVATALLVIGCTGGGAAIWWAAGR